MPNEDWFINLSYGEEVYGLLLCCLNPNLVPLIYYLV